MRLMLAALGLSVSVIATQAQAGPVEDYTELREEVWQATLDTNPGLATSVGDRRGDGKLADLSLAEYDRQIEESRAFLARLKAIDPAQLPADLRVGYAILKRSFDDGLEGAAFDHSRYVLFTNRFGWFTMLGALATRSPFFTLADYESYVSRLEGYATMNAQGLARSRKAVARGLTQACGPMEGLAQQLDRLMFEDATATPYWQPLAEQPATISDAEWAALTARARTALESEVAPALAEFRTFFTNEYMPKCREGAPGVGGTPGGTQYYDYLVRSFTTTDTTADEVHDLGLSEVARIRAEMEDLAAEAGFDTREAFIEHLRTDPKYFMTDADEYVRYVQALAKEIDGWMPKLFGTLPRQPYTVSPIPAAQAPGNTTAYYERGSLATGQPGIYRINTTELDQRPLWELPALGVHEAVPGHHHQIALQQELDLHPLRSNGTYFTAYVEGWGLYSERLGIEMGLYDTPAKQMGRLSYEMWRATRLVVDTGLHSKGWSKQRAVDYMLDNTALTAGNVDAEVNRYITNPGQALAYKIGELTIRRLRARAEKALGVDFDLRQFHDAVLLNGAVPMDLLEEEVDRWIATQQES